MEPGKPQYNHFTAYDIAQQYSSSTFFSLRFHSHKKRKIGARLKKNISFTLLLFQKVV
jgi:hypothetical protein